MSDSSRVTNYDAEATVFEALLRASWPAIIWNVDRYAQLSPGVAGDDLRLPNMLFVWATSPEAKFRIRKAMPRDHAMMPHRIKPWADSIAYHLSLPE